MISLPGTLVEQLGGWKFRGTQRKKTESYCCNLKTQEPLSQEIKPKSRTRASTVNPRVSIVVGNIAPYASAGDTSEHTQASHSGSRAGVYSWFTVCSMVNYLTQAQSGGIINKMGFVLKRLLFVLFCFFSFFQDSLTLLPTAHLKLWVI